MSDERADEADFDDPAHAPIRDLLSSARVDTPIPADVAARLDATLAELTGQASPPVDQDAGAVVVPLRRRLAPRLLAAAVVVAIAGVGAVGLNRVLQDQAGTSDSVTAGAAADSGTESAAEPPAVPQVTSKSNRLLNGFSANAAGGVVALTAADFATQVQRLDLTTSVLQLDTGLKWASGTPESAPGPTPKSADSSNRDQSGGSRRGADTVTSSSAAKALACPGPGIDGTSSYAILLDRKPAVLVVHPATNGTRLVEAWSCDGSQVLAFTTVTS